MYLKVRIHIERDIIIYTNRQNSSSNSPRWSLLLIKIIIKY